MKMKIFVIISSLAFLLFTPLISNGELAGPSRKFLMDIYQNGKITEETMIVYLTVKNHSARHFISWKSVLFIPWNKKILVDPRFHSTDDGTITNITLGEDFFSFDLKVSQDTSIKIFGNKLDQSEYSLEGVYFYWDNDSKQKIKRELKSTNKRSIILPFQEVE